MQPESPGRQIFELVMGTLSGERGVSVETALALLSSVAGFATQVAIREKLVVEGGRKEDEVFKVVTTKDGWNYYLCSEYFPLLLQAPQGQVTVYSMALTGAAQAGLASPPDHKLLEAVVNKVLATAGSPEFGTPLLPAHHMPHHHPIALLRDSWDTLFTLLKLKANGGNALHWPYMIGEAIHLLMTQSKGSIDPNVLMPIYLECAIPMAHIDPRRIIGQTGKGDSLAVDFSRTDAGKLLQSSAFHNALENTLRAQKG